jgi:hypothetical protein
MEFLFRTILHKPFKKLFLQKSKRLYRFHFTTSVDNQILAGAKEEVMKRVTSFPYKS